MAEIVNDYSNYKVSGRDSSYLDLTLVYLNEIGKIPVLTAEEEKELGKTIKTGSKEEAKKARDKMVNSNLRLVVVIAKPYAAKYNEPLLDVVQNGCLGLMKAAEKFDYTLGYKFSTYASTWIRQAITRSHADTYRTIRLPVSFQEISTQMKKIIKSFVEKNNREPTMKEISVLMKISEKEVTENYLMLQDITSLDVPISDSDDSVTLKDFIADDKQTDIALTVTNSLITEKIMQEAQNYLTPNEYKVIVGRFGLEDGIVQSLEEIGNELGVSRERTRQIEAKAIGKIKNRVKYHEELE